MIIEVKLGDKTFQAALLNFAEYKRGAVIFADIQRHSAAVDWLAIVQDYEGFAEILCAAICRTGSQVTIQEIRESASPGEIMQCVGELMMRSSMVGAYPVFGKLN